MTLAALLAYLCTDMVGLHHGYWAVITCLVVIQSSLGATISAGMTRVAGTAAGAIVGVLGVLMLQMYLRLPEWLTLLAVIAPLSLLAAWRALFRLAPLTGALVLLLAGSGNLTFALSRVAEIALGSAIGVFVSLFVLPERATPVLIKRAALILEQLGEFAVMLLSEAEQQSHELIASQLRNVFVQIQSDKKEVENERSVYLLRADIFPESLIRHLQRLRTDLNMLGRAASAIDDRTLYPELAKSIKLQFMTYAAVLRGNAELSEELISNETVLAFPPETPLGFALSTLYGEFVALNETLQQRAVAQNSGARPTDQSAQC